MIVELRVLGPLEIVIDGTVSQSGRAQVRRILALLAAAEGRWVSRDLLEAELWPDDLPRDPRSALHVAVNRARSVFGGAGHDVIVSASDGYRLAEGDVVLDLASWRERIAEAAAQRSAGDLVAAIASLRAAQDLWRGEPFADVIGSERIDAVRHGLGREREDVELLRVELLAAAGRVAEGVVRENVVAHGGEDAGYVVTVRELVSDTGDDMAARRAALPADERAVWEQVGARLDDWDAVARTRARTAAAHAGLISRSIDGDAAVAELLGVDHSRVSQRVAQRSLYSFVGPSGRRMYPRWQFVGGAVLPGLKAVLDGLPPGLHPLVVDRWATAPTLDLEVDGASLSPIDWLAAGGDPSVVAVIAAEVGSVP